jgi:DNA-binding XRE family transcriptional regulator
MSDYFHINFLEEAEFPDPYKDNRLVDCHDCGVPYNDPGRRRGPTLLMFNSNLYQVVCLACYHRSRPGNSQEDAIEFWNLGDQSGLAFHRERMGYSQEELAVVAGMQVATIQRMEQKLSGGSKQTKKMLASVLGVTVKEL